jgi:hypothetical protein
MPLPAVLLLMMMMLRCWALLLLLLLVSAVPLLLLVACGLMCFWFRRVRRTAGSARSCLLELYLQLAELQSSILQLCGVTFELSLCCFKQARHVCEQYDALSGQLLHLMEGR